MQTLYFWVAAEQIRVARFQVWWMDQNDLDPDKFPLDMEPGEWDEQYRAWEG